MPSPVKTYDAIVVGSGCGMNIIEEALAHQKRVALVDKGPLGGTCPNLGCIPSKLLTNVADELMRAREAAVLGLEVEVKGADFRYVMERMRRKVQENVGDMRQGLLHNENLDLYEGVGRFVGEHTMEVDGTLIASDLIFIASGSRTLVPDIEGLAGVDYLTSDTLLQLQEKPESMVIVGGGFVAVEYAHFFAAMGTQVTMLEMSGALLPAEEPEITALLMAELRKRMAVHTNCRVEGVVQRNGGVVIAAADTQTGREREFAARTVLLAVGRRSNADLLEVKRAGIDTDQRDYIKVGDYMETNKKGVFAVGDAIGKYMFTHVGNAEAMVAANNAFHEERVKMDYTAAPHAVYSYPQIASVGLTERQARQQGRIMVGRASYTDVAKGDSMAEERGFAKAIVTYDEGRILGFHIIGPLAPIIIQEVVDAMESGGDMNIILSGMHIHPELPELIVHALGNVQEVE